ncbi:BRCA1 protein, partial [Mionectes macconnelli]|nr:BRCA1 protein [Mionectes macconnelli]
MDFPAVTVGHIQHVLSAMRKNLECPICLDVVQEPVSTKCDHVFCRFCMFKLFSKKKKGVVQCPLCKTEVTKRSLKENSRFKQLIEGLLDTIHAFELDTGVKFLRSHHIHKTSTEAPAAEFLCKESSVIQSKGFRNRRTSAEENGQEDFTLETTVNTQLTDIRVKRSCPRNKPQKRDSQKGVYVELGSDSSEEFFKQASKTGFEDKAAVQISPQEKLKEPESVEKGNEDSCNAQPDKQCAREITVPNVRGESDFWKEDLSKKSTPSISECAKPDQLYVTECQSSPPSVLAADLLPEQCDRRGNSSPMVNRGTSFFKETEEMGEEQTQYSRKNKEFDSKGSSGSRLDRSKEMDTVLESVEAVEVYEPEDDSFHDTELPQEKVLQPEKASPSATLSQVSRKRLKRSIQKVNEWFSKSNEILSSSSSLDDSAGASDVSGEGDACSSDKESCISENTDPMVNSMEIAVVERNERWSKQTVDSIKDKIFGKTYRRERKSNPPSTVRDILSATRKEDVTDDKCLNNSSRDRPKRKRKTACVLQPEDFIKKKEADGGPQSVVDVEKERCDGSVAVNENDLSENRVDNTLTGHDEGGGATRKKTTGKVTSKRCDGELKMHLSDQKSAKKSSAAKRCRHSTRAMCALQLVVDRNSVSPDPAEPQIDSYPSSGEPRRADSEHSQVRRSRRLQVLAEGMAKGTGKGVIVKGPRRNHSDHGGSVFGDRRNVAAQAAEDKDLCEPRGVLDFEAVTSLKGGDLEANEMQVSLKNLSDTAETGNSLFNPAPLCQPSNCGSFAPHSSSQDSEIQGSPVLIEPPSMPAEQTAPHQTEEMTESLTSFPQERGCESQSGPGDFRAEKLPVAKTVLELAREAEDSDLDTQYLRNIFRHSKRLSFSLYQTPRQTCAVEDPDPESLNPSGAAQVEDKSSKCLQPENLQEAGATAESSSRIWEKEKLKTCESACVGHVSCFAVSTGEDRQAAKEGTLTPVRAGTAESEAENQSLKGKQGNEKPVSTDTGIEGELRQNPVRSNESQSEQSNTGEHDSKQTSLNIGHEIGLTPESNLEGKSKVVDDKEPILHIQSGSVICPASCQQGPAEFSPETMRQRSSKSKRKQIEDSEEQATQTARTAMPECLIAETLRGNSDFTGLSETPDGLLCSDADTEENTSFGETDRREQSAVFVKGSDSALGEEPHVRNVGSKPGSRDFQKPRRRAQKLPSSDEESCEGEDLPCFQTLIFGKSASTPLQVDKQVTSVLEASAGPSMLAHSGSKDDNIRQKMPEVAPSNVCASPSQESECSVNLFSSQSMSEESVNEAQELKEPLLPVDASKQVSSVNESKETSQSCNGRLKRTKPSSKGECQEDSNMGANLGEASGYESETSIVEDSCEPFSQGEILTTQQKNAMQNSLRKLQQEMAVLEAALKQQGSQACELLPVSGELPHASIERTFGMEQMREEKERSVFWEDQESGTRQNSASVSSNLSGNVIKSPNNSSSSARPLNPGTAEVTNGSVAAQNTQKSCGPGHRLKKSVCFPVPVLHDAAGKENATVSPAVTKRREMSIVASGLNHSEHLVVQKFVRKTQSTLSNHITEGTTHVIMKTDEELVCERTLKYFLGIAGRKWVVSYQWVIQSLKEERILDEENFEVRGDVINGRNHQGPKRARQSQTEKV